MSVPSDVTQDTGENAWVDCTDDGSHCIIDGLGIDTTESGEVKLTLSHMERVCNGEAPRTVVPEIRASSEGAETALIAVWC